VQLGERDVADEMGPQPSPAWPGGVIYEDHG
jgi:hypothetical protein